MKDQCKESGRKVEVAPRRIADITNRRPVLCIEPGDPYRCIGTTRGKSKFVRDRGRKRDLASVSLDVKCHLIGD